jgi:hypothetical protein
MNLNKEHRAEIVRKVVSDIPVQFANLQDQLQKMADDDLIVNLPPEVAAVYKDRELRAHLSLSSYFVGNTPKLSSIYPDNWYVTVTSRNCLKEKTKTKLSELLSEAREARTVMIEAVEKLEGSLRGVKTLKQFKEMFPELEKYAPEEEVKVSHLPALANVMAGLSSLGWPKGDDKAVAA